MLCTIKGFSGEYYTPVCSGSAVVPASVFSLSCTSSNPAVASVNKTTGLVTTKKAGKTNITMKIGKKIKVTLNLTVVKAGKLGTNGKYKELTAAAAKLSGNLSNAQLKTAIKKYMEALKKTNAKLDDMNKFNAAGFPGQGSAWCSKDELIIPMAGRYAYYCSKMDPVLEISDNSIAEKCKPKSMKASAGSTSISVSLNSAVSKDMIDYMKLFNEPYMKSSSKIFYTNPTYGLSINGTEYSYRLKLTAGSKTIQIVPCKFVYNSKKGTETYKKITLKKGDRLAFRTNPNDSRIGGRGDYFGFDSLKAIKVK